MKQMKFINIPIFKSMVESVDIICKENHVDDTHGLAHSLKIAELTQRALLTQELQYGGIIYSNIMYAALLHDIDDRKYFKTSQNCCNARRVLLAHGIAGQRECEVISMIDSVSFSKHGNSIDSSLPHYHYIPRYIDRSEAIGVEGLYRTLQYSLNRQKDVIIFNESTPRPLSVSQVYQASNGRDEIYKKNGGNSASVIDHFFDKLVHIKLPAAIKTPFLIELYHQKHTQMVEFVLKHAKDNYTNFRSQLEYLFKKQQKR